MNILSLLYGNGYGNLALPKTPSITYLIHDSGQFAMQNKENMKKSKHKN